MVLASRDLLSNHHPQLLSPLHHHTSKLRHPCANIHPFALCLRLCSQMWAGNKAHHYWLHLKFMMIKLLSLTWPTTLTSNHTAFLLAIHSPSPRWRFKPTHSPTLLFPYCLAQLVALLPILLDSADNSNRTPAALHHYTYMHPCPLHAHPYRVRVEWAALWGQPATWALSLFTFAVRLLNSSNCPYFFSALSVSPFSCIINITIL